MAATVELLLPQWCSGSVGIASIPPIRVVVMGTSSDPLGFDYQFDRNS